MNSLTDHKFSILLTGLLLITGLSGIPTAFASSEDPGATTTDVEAVPTSTGANHGGSGHNLKVYGAPLWDLTNSNADGTIQWSQRDDLGNDNEFDRKASDHFDSILFEPAYVENGADGDSAEHLVTDLSVQYRPTYWAPSTDSVEPGTSNALFDVASATGNFNPDFIFDEDVDSGIDDGSTDDAIDLLGTEDNIPDYASRNADTGEGNDLYFSAFVNTYNFTTYQADHSLGSVTNGDRIQLPVSGLGGQAGVNSYSAAKTDTEVVVQNVDSTNDDVRLQTEDIKLTPGDKIRFWDFQATLESVSGSDDPSAAWTIHWLGDYDNPEKVGSKVTTKANQIVTADTGSLSTPGDCSGNRPADPGTDNLWYLCPTTVNGQNGFVFATAGRLFSDVDVNANSGEQAGTILVNGALYHVSDFTFASGNLQNMEIEHVVPTRGDFELESLDLSLKGVSRGSDIPVLPPFNGDHQAVEQYDLEPNLNSHGFLRGEDGNSNGIETDGIDLKASDEDIDDRLTDRSALSISWEASAREEGLLANREEAGASDWSVDFQNTYPNHYAEINTPDGTTQVVDSGLYGQLTGFDKFLFESGTDDPIQVGPNGLRLYSDTLDTASDDGDVLRPNPAIDTDADARAGGSKANVLVEPKFSYDAHTVFDHRATDVDSTSPSVTAPDTLVDLNVLSDEESSDHTGVDDDANHDTIDENADNLFSFEGPQNNAEDQGDIYSPAIRQEYTYRWLSQGSNDPVSAGLAGSVTEGTTTSDTEITLPVATETHDSKGLDSCNVGGDADCEDVIVEFYQNTQLHGESSSSQVFRLESTKITLDLGERAQFFDHEVQVDSTDTSYTNPRARFSFYQVDSGGDSNGDEVGNGIDGINEGNFVGLTYDYSQASSKLVTSPKQSSDLNHDDASSPSQLDYEWYVYVDTINSDSVTLNVGRLVKDTGDFFVDGQQYSVTSDDAVGSPIDSISIETDTPVGSEAVDLVQPSITIDSISAGDTVPVLTPFNEDHDVVDTTSVDVEDNQYGAFDNLGSDGDTTAQSTSERIVQAPALDITVEETGARDKQSFIYSEAGANNQAVNGIFQGSDAGSITRGHIHGGFPDNDFQNRPTSSNHEGESFSGTWPNAVDNKKRGFKEYVSLSFKSGVGQYLFQSARIESFDDGTTDGAGASSVKWLQAGCSALQGGSDGPCVAANTASDGAKSWIALESSDITDFLLGTGAEHQVPPEEQAETGLSNFVADSISCGTSTLQRGQSVGCDITVQNTGSRSGTKSVELKVTSPGGSTSTASGGDVTIDAGASKTVSRTWSTTSTTELGDWSLQGVTPDDQTSTTTVTVEKAPGEGTPNIVVNSVSVSPGTVTVGDAVTVSGQAENTGDGDGSKSFDVILDGETIGTVTVSVDAGATQNFATQITPTKSGEFTVEVGSKSAQLTVNPKDSDGDGIPDPQDSCPNQAADTDDGCPAADGDGGGPPDEDKGPVPGFSAYALITALVSAALLARRRTRT